MVTIDKLAKLTGLKATDLSCLETDHGGSFRDHVSYFEDETGGTYDVMYPIEELFHSALGEEIFSLTGSKLPAEL